VVDPERPSAQRELDWADELDARDPSKREQHRLRVCIGVSGWLSSPSDVNKPWEVIDATSTEPFALRFELDAMLRLGNSLNDVLFSYAWDGVAYTVMSRTILGALYAGLWPLGLIKAASVLDNPFSVALARADKAGKVLAHALIDGVQGKRPVTLTGYSVGARVIYSCLVELAEQHAFGLVECAVLMGTPAPSDSKPWRQIRSVVAGRVVNAHSSEDYVLGFLYRSTKLQVGVAGLQSVEDVSGIENVDVSKLVSGHDQYRYLVGKILAKIGFGDLEFERVAEQERALEVVERKKKQVKEQAKRNTEDSRAEPAAPQTIADTQKMQAVPQPKQSSTQPLIDFSSLDRDSSTGITPKLASPPSHTQLFAPAMYASHSRQIPSRISSQSTETPTQTLQSEERSIKIPNFTPQDSDVSKNVTVGLQKTGPNVAVTEVMIVGGGLKGDTPSDDDDFDCDAEDISSDFGELVMVEPVPMDDFDYGLM
jgi:hypothetical protein